MGRKPSDRPEAILEGALHEFAERGFDGATWRGIAERAGVAQSLVTYHYGDKERLWREAYRLARRRKTHANPPLPNCGPDGEEPSRQAVSDWLYAYCRGFARHPELSRMQVAEGQKGSERTRWAARDSLRADYDRFVEGIDALKARGWFPDATAHQLVYMLVGAAQYAFLMPGQIKALTGANAQSDAYADAHARAVTALFMRFA